MINFISLPSDVKIEPFWMDTPSSDKRAKEVACSIFTQWPDQRLKSVNYFFTFNKFISIMGLTLSFFWQSIPVMIFCFGSLMVCHLSKKVIRQEQIHRCRKACFHLEDWLVLFKNRYENLHSILQQFFFDDKDDQPNSANLKSEDLKKIIQAISKFPDNDLYLFLGKLEENFQTLFGHWRKIGPNQWSSYWIEHHLKINFYEKILRLYRTIHGFKECVKEYQEITNAHNTTNVIYRAYEFFRKMGKKESEEIIDPISIKTDMYLLTGNSDAPPQGHLHFSKITDEVEYWRQNIALFRSSLS